LLSKIKIKNTQWVEDHKRQILHINDPHALISAAGYLKYKLATDSSQGLYFRGQNKLYDSLSPTLFRGVETQSSKSKRSAALKDLIQQFTFEGSIFNTFGSYAHEPLLQHYGISTTWIDLVDNIWVALWFACHQAQTSGKNKEYLHFEKRLPSLTNYAYILLIGADINFRNRSTPGLFHGNDTELIDLRMAVPGIFLRPHSQHGLLFRQKGKNQVRPTDYSDNIKGILRIDLDKALAWLGDGKALTTHSIFPPPYYDNGYNILLDVNINAEKFLGNISYIGA
jgi:hypothetical protein